jgi:hypothetical protein
VKRLASLAGTLLAVTPIPFVPTTPSYTGHAASPDPVKGIRIPHNRYMAPNGKSEIHDDGWQTDSMRFSGPLGRSPQTTSTLLSRDCATIAFDRRGRIVSICIGASGPQLYMFDPNTLDTLATFSLPPRTAEDIMLNPNLFQDFSNGGYFYLDNQDRVVTGTTSQHIYVIAERGGSPGFKLVGDYDLSRYLHVDEELTSALPDSNGLLWFVARRDGVVGTLNFKTRQVHVIRLGHGGLGEIENSFATDQHGGVYIATNRKLYRFTATPAPRKHRRHKHKKKAKRRRKHHRHNRARSTGVPRIVWQVTYPNSFEHKVGQVDDGTGTTPTVMQGGYVNITDNADPMDIVVYRTAPRPMRVVKRHHHRRRVRIRRLVCKVPIFQRGSGADENSLIVAGRAMIAENNYGYVNPSSVTGGKVTAPGFVRVDINRNGRGCHRVWTNNSERAPTVVSKVSLGNGLIYTYTKASGPMDPWYWTAIDFRTGRTVYKQLSGTGNLGYNNNYAGIAIGPNGREYLGVLGGMISLTDS